MKSALQEYCEQVLDGSVVACKKMRKLCERLLRNVEHGYKEWHFDRDKAERACYFIETFCKIPSGRLGQPFKLEPFEKAIVQAIFGFVDDAGLRQYQEAFIEMARKNGKTSLCAAIEWYMLIADGEGAPQIYNVATSMEQASLAYNACVRMYKQSGALTKYARKRADDLYSPLNFGYIKPLSANTGTMDGLDVHLAILDEMAAMKNRDLYDLVKQGMSAREQPLLISISTNGFIRNGLFDAQYAYAEKWLDGTIVDDRFIAFIYELDEREEWTDESKWVKANPGLGPIKKWETLRGYVSKAKNDPAFRATVFTKDFNIPENNSVAWLTFDEAVNRTPFKLEKGMFRYGICGFDASDSIDLTSAQMLMMRPGDDHIYVHSMYWIPEDVIRADEEAGNRRERDAMPYQQWIARGLMRTVPGNKIDKRVLLEWLEEMRDEYDVYTYALGVDPWHMDDSTLRDLKMFVGDSRVFKVRQGAQTLSQPMKQLKADYGIGRVIDGNHPLNQACRMNVSIRTDINGNIQPDKKLNDPRNRIDGFVAELIGYVTLLNNMDGYMQMI